MPLVSDAPSKLVPHWASSWPSHCCTVWWRSCSPESIEHPPNPTPVLQQITDGVDVVVGQHITLLLILASIALASSLLAVRSKGWGQFSGFQVLWFSHMDTFKASSTVLSR